MPVDLPSPPLPPLPSFASHSILPQPNGSSLPRSRTAPDVTQLAHTYLDSSPRASLAAGPSTHALPSLPSACSSNGGSFFPTSSSDARVVLHLLPNPPLPEHLAPYLSPESPLSSEGKRDLFTSVYLRACSSGNADTLEWLLSLPPDPSLSVTENAAAARRFSLTAASIANTEVPDSPRAREKRPACEVNGILPVPDTAARRWIDLEAADEEGYTALGICVALGHAECVRVLVEGGVKVNQTDRAGWTPLHWAVQNNDIPIAAYLLNRRASPALASRKGLTPRDLVKPGREGSAMREVLKSAWEAALERDRSARPDTASQVDERDPAGSSPNGRPSSRLSLAASDELSWVQAHERDQDIERDGMKRKRVQLGKESAVNLEVDFEILGLEDEAAVDEDEQDEVAGVPDPFCWDRCEPDQMIVFALDELPVLFNVVISTIKPVSTRKFRVIPANALFLCARYAHHFGSEEMLDELIFGALERIEEAVHNRPDDMTVCAFWLSNCLLFLHYLRKEPNLCAATPDYQSHFKDLINEIFVFIIRDAERRIDRVLEAAILDHEALPGFEDVAFEDEWASTRFVKKLTGRAKKGSIRHSTSARSLFSEAGSATSSIGLSPHGGGEAGASPPRLVSASTVPISEATPRSVTALLSSTLFVLQTYEIPPAIIVQAFSQLFYWIACETFNRLLNQRKYLCRTRAMQIRLNASSLEEWSRSNRLPAKMVATHFAPLNQLLQWLQCLSSETTIDGLIGTVQSLTALNPLQLRKAVKDYRYEVDETRMDEDCAQYLVQIQRQWERNRLQKETAAAAAAAAANTSPEADELSEGDQKDLTRAEPSSITDIVRSIDEAFQGPSAYASYAPPAPAESTTELLNSRFMLPFAVPTLPELLVSADSFEAFGPFAHSPPMQPPSGSENGLQVAHSVSRLSLSSITLPSLPTLSPTEVEVDPTDQEAERGPSAASPGPADAALPSSTYIPILPDDFFAVFDAAKANAGHAAQPSTAAALLAAHPAAGASPEGGWGAPTPEFGAGPRGTWWGSSADPERGSRETDPDASLEFAGSVLDHHEFAADGGTHYGRNDDGEEADLDDSFDAPSTAGDAVVGVDADETPRLPSGFQQ